MLKNIRLSAFIVLAVLVFAGCTGRVDGFREVQPSDTLYTAEKAWEAFYQDPQRALVILDSAERLGNTNRTDATLVRARIYSNNESTKDTARTLCMQLLAEGGLKAKQQAEVLDMLVYVARMRDDDEGILKYGMQYINACRQMGNEAEALFMQSEMGEALIRLGRTDEGFAKMDDAIAQLDRVRRFAEFDACVRAMKGKIRSLDKQNRYEEIIPVAERIIEKMSDYGEHPADYDDGSEHMPTEDRRPGYIDWYTGQAYAFMAYAYAMMADNRIDGQADNRIDGQTDNRTVGQADNRTGGQADDRIIRKSEHPKIRKSYNLNIQKSKECLALFDKTDYSKSVGGKKMISATWCLLGEYDKMLAFYDELAPMWGADTLHSDYAIMLRDRATAARAKGNYRASDAYMQRYASLLRTLGDSERLAAAQEYAARYHEQEQQLALEKEKAAKKRLGMVVVFLGILTMMAIVFIVIIVRQLLSIRQKNAVLTKEISERISYEEKYIASKQNTENPNIRTSDNPEIRTSEIASLSDSELFDYIRKIVSEENLHLDPQFGRDQLVERLQLSKERIGAAFARGSDYGNISNFLNDARLFHSTKILTEHPEMPIAEVAAASGFSNRVVFSRNFKERFAMTPSEFRDKKG
ncbi:MAG: AraC family transcriptional regulator [Bacteroidales bacterium]|nr:AraC family transcriptional regulator [Bacteroidales bacterium]